MEKISFMSVCLSECDTEFYYNWSQNISIKLSDKYNKPITQQNKIILVERVKFINKLLGYLTFILQGGQKRILQAFCCALLELSWNNFF